MKRVYRNYNRVLIACLFISLFVIASFNVIVDPYGVWRILDLNDFNATKTERRDQNYLFKAVDLAHREAPVMLYGSSRAAYGLSPKTAAQFLDCSDCVYNGALTGGHMSALTAYLEHTLNHGAQLDTVIWAIDFFAFDAGTSLPPVFRQNRLNSFGMSAYDLMFTTIGGTTLMSSIRTLQANILVDQPPKPYFNNGQLTAQDMAQQVKRRGMRARFRRSLDLYLNGRFCSYQNSGRAWREFGEALEKLRLRDVRVLVFVPPTHIAHLKSLKLRGLWGQWTSFKRRLAQYTVFWDFSGINMVTTESIEDNMSYYWDLSHFRTNVGDRILARMFNTMESSESSEFGTLVSRGNVEQVLRKEKIALAEWQKMNPEEAQFIENQGKPCSP